VALHRGLLVGPQGVSAMTTTENLQTLKLQLHKQLEENLSAEQSEWIEGELVKIDIALSFLEEAPNRRYPAGQLRNNHSVAARF
jgi:hypothetical protein